MDGVESCIMDTSTSSSQLPDLCFNEAGHAFKVPESLDKDFRAGSVVVWGYTPTSHSAIEFLGSLKESDMHVPDLNIAEFRAPSIVSDEVVGEIVVQKLDQKIRYLIVGFVPAHSTGPDPVTSDREDEIGTFQPEEQLEWDGQNNSRPLFAAITVIQPLDPSYTQLFALLQTDVGLRGYAIDRKEVFYFHMYRHAAPTSDVTPRFNWINTARNVAVGLACSHEIQFESATEMFMRVTEYTFEPSFADLMEFEVHNKWPEIDNVTSPRLLSLRHGLESAGIDELLPCHVRSVVACGVAHVDEWPEGARGEQTRLIVEAVKHALDPWQRHSCSAKMDENVLNSVAEQVREIGEVAIRVFRRALVATGIAEPDLSLRMANELLQKYWGKKNEVSPEHIRMLVDRYNKSTCKALGLINTLDEFVESAKKGLQRNNIQQSR